MLCALQCHSPASSLHILPPPLYIYPRILIASALLFPFDCIIMEASDASVQPGQSWDEAQCTEALAQLERLQTQVHRGSVFA